jgi:hypothetical protein
VKLGMAEKPAKRRLIISLPADVNPDDIDIELV